MMRVTWHYFDMDSNEISAEQWAVSMVSGVIKSAIENYTYRAVENVSQMTCPVHGGKAELTFNVTGIPENISTGIHVTGCCDEFAQNALQEAYRSWPTE